MELVKSFVGRILDERLGPKDWLHQPIRPSRSLRSTAANGVSRSRRYVHRRREMDWAAPIEPLAAMGPCRLPYGMVLL